MADTGRSWPEEDRGGAERPTPPRGLLARVGRALKDAFITAGMAGGMQGDNAVGEATRSTANSMLFGAGRDAGREANRGSTTDPD